MNCWGSNTPPAFPPPYAPVVSIFTFYQTSTTNSTKTQRPLMAQCNTSSQIRIPIRIIDRADDDIHKMTGNQQTGKTAFCFLCRHV